MSKQQELITEKSINLAILLERRFSGCYHYDVNIVTEIVSLHDKGYNSINLGKDVIKEMIQSSVSGTPITAKSATIAYRIILQRVILIAKQFAWFSNLPEKVQDALLQHNADMIINLRAAVFFQKHKQGLDQIRYSVGLDDIETVETMIVEEQQLHSSNKSNSLENYKRNYIRIYKTIEYKNFNTIQKIESDSPAEQRFDIILARVGECVDLDENLVIMLSYILLFSNDLIEERINVVKRKSIEKIQEDLISILQSYLYVTYPETAASKLFKNMLGCPGKLRELCSIMQRRQKI